MERMCCLYDETTASFALDVEARTKGEQSMCAFRFIVHLA